jgi:catechol 2,3-dioxygenase-like lactoylglutathione lyase family enzyme
VTGTISGLHHITAISSNAQHNLNFYANVVGLRFVKKTVNFDDPSTYHLYYGDEVGTPGTVLTFFFPGSTSGAAAVASARPRSRSSRSHRAACHSGGSGSSAPGRPWRDPVPSSTRSVWCSRIRMA